MINALLKAFYVVPEKRNVGTSERFVSSFAGTLLALSGFRNFRKGGCLLLAPAAYLLYRSASGYCPVNEKIDRDTTEGANDFFFSYSTLIYKPVDEVYKFWRKFENLPVFMSHLDKVDKLDEKNYRWTAIFNDQEFEWTGSITEDIPNQVIAWKSTEPSDIHHEGKVEFREFTEGVTEFKVRFIYTAAKTKLGEVVARLFSPLFKYRVKRDIKNFKNILENREVLSD